LKRFSGRLYTGLFVIIHVILYAAFLTLDLTGTDLALSSKIKFSIIILCFCFALFYRNSADKSIIFCIRTALLFTVVSDLFLLLLDYYFYGVLTFIIVQQLYAIRLLLPEGSKNGRTGLVLLRSYIIRLLFEAGAAICICLILSRLGVMIDVLLIVSVFYFICILTNAITALMAAVKNRGEKGLVLFAVGIGLFLLCDINVGLFNLSGFVSLPKEIEQTVYSVSSILMWTFYAPSQVLISLSTRFEALGKINKN
jgi:hypothetical protein